MKIRLRLAAQFSFLALALGTGCGGCEKKASEPPSAFLSKQAELVLDIPDIGAVAKRRALLVERFGGLVKPDQLKELEQTLTRMIGFDLTTPQGLAAAGLPPTGAAAMEFIDQGRGALWVVPVADAEKLKAALSDVVKGRIQVDDTQEKDLAAPLSGKLTTFSRSFGDEKIPVAAFSIQKSRGYVIIGAGPKSPDLVQAALGRKREESLATSAEYAALAGVGGASVARVVIPDTRGMLKTVAAQDLPSDAFAREIVGTVWWLSVDEKAISLEGQARLSEAGQKTLATLLAVKGPAPVGVRASLGGDPAFVIYGAGSPQDLLNTFAPGGTTLRGQLDNAFDRAREELGVDLVKDLVPLSSGHGVLAMGFNAFTQLPPLPEFLQAPAKYLWTTVALGLTSEEEAKKALGGSDGLKKIVERRGLELKTREAGGVEVTSLTVPGAGAEAVIADMFTTRNAWITTNASVQTDRIVAALAKPTEDPLKGRGGFVLEARVEPIRRTLKALDLGAFQGGAEAILLRSVQSRALEVFEPLQRVEFRLEAAPGGLGAALRVELAPAAPPKK